MTPSPMSDRKSALRQALIGRRRMLRGAARAAATRRICALAATLPQFKPGARIAVYESFGSELNPAPLIRAARRRGICLYAPVVTDFARRRMQFLPLDRIRGPVHPGQHIPARWLHLILCPVVGIDTQGFRLGMGAGFFDRALAFRGLRRHWRGPAIIALAFDCQRTESVHPQAWDARMDGLITESGLHLFRKGST
jgi:5-formyltetrahydrofolate cyclo-ligase